MNLKDTIRVQTCKLTKEEFTQFISLYPIPSEYHVMLPKQNHTIFDAPYGLNPFGCAKLTTFIIMCKEYGCEPPVDLFRGLFNSFPGGRFFFVQDSVVPANYPELLCKDNRWDTKSFRDKLPDNIHENLSFQRLGRYPTSVRVFPDHILFMDGLKSSWKHGQQHPAIIVDGKEMAFKNFMYAKTDDDITFLPKGPLLEFRTRSPSVSINTEPPIAEARPTGQLVENIADSGDSPYSEQLMIHPGSVAARIRERKCRTRRGSSKPPVKHKLVHGASFSRSTRAKVAASKDDSPFLTILDDDESLPDVLELQNANAYNAVNKRSQELLKVIDQIRAECDVMKEREKVRDQECEELKAKCEAAMIDFDKNPAVNVLREKISSLFGEVKLEATEASLRQELENARLDRAEVVSKVVPYVATELAQSDDMGRLVAKLVSSAIFYGRCHAFEEVANMKEPFDITKVKGYQSSYKQEHTKAGNEFATSIFLYLADVVADPHVSIEVLLSKKPRVLQRPIPMRTHMLASSAPSQKASPSHALMSPPSQITPAAASVSKTQSPSLAQ
ncbi:hypothetical protein Tco_0620655 [Tanacetum coccineum]